MRSLLRKQISDSQSYRLGPTKIISTFVKTVFGYRRKGDALSEELYCITLKNEIKSRFPNSLFPEEILTNYNLRKSIDMISLLGRFQKMTGITISPRIHQYYEENSLPINSYIGGKNSIGYDKHLLQKDLIVREDDIIDLIPIISFMHIVNFSYAAKVSIQYKYQNNNIGIAFLSRS
jgi:hypothetical protein